MWKEFKPALIAVSVFMLVLIGGFWIVHGSDVVRGGIVFAGQLIGGVAWEILKVMSWISLLLLALYAVMSATESKKTGPKRYMVQILAIGSLLAVLGVGDYLHRKKEWETIQWRNIAIGIMAGGVVLAIAFLLIWLWGRSAETANRRIGGAIQIVLALFIAAGLFWMAH